MATAILPLAIHVRGQIQASADLPAENALEYLFLARGIQMVKRWMEPKDDADKWGLVLIQESRFLASILMGIPYVPDAEK